ncbi:MAG: hypothetical protein Q8P18_25755 [Pseudomonadota bacterium]|nr:hypothetical protein [Pseudomonadota bacterium]
MTEHGDRVTAEREGVDCSPRPERVGILEIGSQTTTLALFRTGTGGLRRTEQMRVALPLVRHLSSEGELAPEAVSKIARVVGKLGRYARRRGWRRLKCVATSAVRDAVNALDVVAEVVARSGLILEILDGRAEGEAAGLAVTNTLPVRDGCFFDLGGGSLQLGRLRAGRCHRVESLPLGALRMAVQHLGHHPPGPAELGALEDRVAAALAEHRWVRGARQLVGVGGTIRALAKVDRLANGWPIRHSHGYWLSADAVREGVQRLVALSPKERASLGVPRHRVNSILAGGLIIRAILLAGGFEGVRVCGFGVRYGVAHQLMGVRAPEQAHRGAAEWRLAVTLADQLRGSGRATTDRLLGKPLSGWYQEEALAAAALLGNEDAARAMDRMDVLAGWRRARLSH